MDQVSLITLEKLNKNYKGSHLESFQTSMMEFFAKKEKTAIYWNVVIFEGNQCEIVTGFSELRFISLELSVHILHYKRKT